MEEEVNSPNPLRCLALKEGMDNSHMVDTNNLLSLIRLILVMVCKDRDQDRDKDKHPLLLLDSSSNNNNNNGLSSKLLWDIDLIS